MARRPLRTALVLACAVAVGSAVLLGKDGGDALDGGDPSLLTDRVWLEAMPEEPTKALHAVLFTAEAPFGAFVHGSAYRATVEVFEFERDGGAVTLRFPQTGRKAEVRARAAACDDEPPFDLCLDLSDNPWEGPRRYYGFRDEGDAGAAIARLRHRLSHAAIDGP